MPRSRRRGSSQARAKPHASKELGQRVRELRSARGLSQARLGEPYYTRALVSAVELGKVGPSVTALRHFASQLNVSVDALLEHVDALPADAGTAEMCRSVGPLHDLVRLFPELAEVIRHYSSSHFVPVSVNTCSRPQRSDGSLYGDRVVFGLFYVDRTQVAVPDSQKVIRQDYFVVGGEPREMHYYSGEKRAWKRLGSRPIHWRDIRDFCVTDGYAGPGGCYGCHELSPGVMVPKHWYGASNPDLPSDPEPVWRLAFELAIAVARRT